MPQEMQLFEAAPGFASRRPDLQPPTGRRARARGTNLVVTQSRKLDPLQMWVKRLNPILRSQAIVSLTHATSNQKKVVLGALGPPHPDSPLVIAFYNPLETCLLGLKSAWYVLGCTPQACKPCSWPRPKKELRDINSLGTGDLTQSPGVTPHLVQQAGHSSSFRYSGEKATIYRHN